MPCTADISPSTSNAWLLRLALGLSSEPNPFECLSVSGTVGGTEIRIPRTKSLLQFGRIPVLAQVGETGGDFDTHGGTDVYKEIRDLGHDQPGLQRLVRSQAVRQLLGVIERVTRIGVERFKGRATDGPVIAMCGVWGPRVLSVVGDHEIGAMPPHLPGDLATQAGQVVELTVTPAQEDYLLDTQQFCCYRLLRLPLSSDVGRACPKLGSTFVPGGYDHQGGLAADAREARHRAGAVRLHVVRVGNNHEDPPKAFQSRVSRRNEVFYHVSSLSHGTSAVEVVIGGPR